MRQFSGGLPLSAGKERRLVLAALAEAIDATVVSEDLEGLGQFVPTRRWTDIAF